MDDKNIYHDINVLINALMKSSYCNYAKRITNAIESGSTGTEILMAVRWNLSIILEDNIPDSLKKSAYDIKERINALL